MNVVNCQFLGNSVDYLKNKLQIYDDKLFIEYTSYHVTAIEVNSCSNINLNNVDMYHLKGTFGAGVCIENNYYT